MFRCGVPQGSILGPLLFVIDINDLAKYIIECKLNLYADDTTLYNASPSYVDLMLSLRLEMTTLIEWMLANKLTLNVKKTKLMIFGSKPKLSKMPVNTMNSYISNEIVEYVHSFKYLGVILDESLNFNEHVDQVYKKSCMKLGAIKKYRTFLSNNLTIILYKSLVVPYIDYCDIVYMQTNQANLQKLQLVQNMACRIILKAGPRDHILDMQKESPYLCDRGRLHLVSECHKF